MTEAEVRERFRIIVRDTLRNLVMNREVFEATQTVRAGVNNISMI